MLTDSKAAATDVGGETPSELSLTDPRVRRKLAAALGRLGGLKGGKARAKKMTKEERSASASKAARARWAKKS